MRRASLLGLLLLGCAAAPASFSAVDVQTGQSVQLSKTKLRDYQSFSGRYTSPQLGALLLEQHGNKLEGSYTDLVCGCPVVGTLVGGTVSDNLARFRVEEKRGRCGQPPLAASGFLFFHTLGPRGKAPELYGSLAYQLQRQPGSSHSMPGDAPPLVLVARGVEASAPVANHCP